MANYQNILRQAHQAIADVADNADSWRAFLRSAAYTTHYAFPNQALIYSQRPGATMLADIDTWNRAAGRWVNRGAHGVASLAPVIWRAMCGICLTSRTPTCRQRLQTIGLANHRCQPLSDLQALQEKHNAESLPEIFGLQAALFVAQHGKQLDADLQNAVIGSTLEWAKPQEQTAILPTSLRRAPSIWQQCAAVWATVPCRRTPLRTLTALIPNPPFWRLAMPSIARDGRCLPKSALSSRASTVLQRPSRNSMMRM